MIGLGFRPPLERIRLFSGLVLFGYLLTHLLNHAAGLASLDAMEAGLRLFQRLWQNLPATVLLYGALATHLTLVLYSLYRRRTLRMSAGEVAQIVLGLSVPPLMVLHVLATRYIDAAFGSEPTYAYVVKSIAHDSSWQGWAQSAGLVVAWTHGCIGLYYWLRLKPWWPAVQEWALAGAVLLPVAALSGFLVAVREVAYLQADPAWVAALYRGLRPPDAEQAAQVYALRDSLQILLAAAVAGVAVARGLRRLVERHRGLVAISYPSGRIVRVTPGTTVLEASRLAGIPHASVCGGRGRCSTCRVRVRTDPGALAPPEGEERAVLERIQAEEHVRLACQIAPRADVAVMPLLPAGAEPDTARRARHWQEGMEQEIVVLFADIRGFTRFSEERLPFDVVFVLNQYFRTVGEAIEGAGGFVDKFIGDGVMALFGLNSTLEEGARAALEAARAMSEGLVELNRALANDLEAPLRIGIGIHSGPVIVGTMGYARTMGLTAIGDTVNTASRLESASKDFTAELVVSRRVARRAGVDLSAFQAAKIQIRGRSEPLALFALPRATDLPPVGQHAPQVPASA
ncbi:adenylate/guanylate cyclase domain-containing protein [Zavarzinia sp. CC-PAN008]|uniref:adenylate/guanylate cyclase domain-containing protein n=1 Tax=Zavarzinia sp. CC-PAN008 TaxID=3243332 RepID=UPI003F744A95